MSRRKVRIVAVCALAAFAGGTAAFVVSRRSPAKHPASFAFAVGAPSHAPIPARPAPAEPPVPVAAGGPCGAAMTEVRTLMRDNPAGSTLSDRGNEALTAGLARLDQACAATPALDQAFRDRELTPWLTYLPPEAA